MERLWRGERDGRHGGQRAADRRRRGRAGGYANEGDQHVTETEIRAYLERGALKHPNSAVTGLALLVDGEDVDIRYELAPVRSIASVASRGISWERWIAGTMRKPPRNPTASSTAFVVTTAHRVRERLLTLHCKIFRALPGCDREAAARFVYCIHAI